MARLQVTPNLTDAHSDRVSRFIETSHKEMAHWAGTGPEGAMCHQCEHFHYLDAVNEKPVRAAYYKRKPRTGELKDEGRPCMKFRRMMDVELSRRIPPCTAACRFFEAIKS